MEIYFLDADFAVCGGPYDELRSVCFSEKYFSCGSFTLHMPRELFREASEAVYVRTGFSESGVKCGRIEYVLADEDGGCEVGGIMLEGILGDRVLMGKGCISGTVTEAVIGAVSENLRGCGVTVGECAELDDEAVLTYEWDNLSDWLYSVLRPYGASYRITLDGGTNRPVFGIVRGTDRSTPDEGGAYNPWQAVFSTSFGNLLSAAYSRSTLEMKNVVYVEGPDGTVIRAGEDAGGLREMHKRVTDVDPADFDTDEKYRAALLARGSEILAKHRAAVTVEAAADPEVDPEYGRDYSLGDICDVADAELELSFGVRLVAVDEVWESGSFMRYPYFGDEIRSIRRLIRGGRDE